MGERGKMNNTTYSVTTFEKDIQKGKPGENIFVEDFLEFLKVNYENVTDVQGFRVIDTDFTSFVGSYEIKTNYKDNKEIIIEEYTNINKAYGPISYGWFYKSSADTLVFISKKTRAMILVPFSKEFKQHYETIKENQKLIWNRVSQNYKGDKWQSAFRKIPLSLINGYFAYYNKVNL
jgi:hypothetical protein